VALYTRHNTQLVFAALALLALSIIWIKPPGPRTRLLKSNLKNARAHWQELVRQWNATASLGPFSAAKDQLNKARTYVMQLDDTQKQRLAQLDSVSAQLAAHLLAHRITAASIAGVGPTRAAQLAAVGVRTANDITYARISSIPGFGPSLCSSLLNWREAVQRSFVHNPNASKNPTAIKSIEAEFAPKRLELLAEIRTGKDLLERKRAEILNARERLRGPMADAWDGYMTAKTVWDAL
jgi:DNA-binding helix-hairpin-helix protein with protein kinase domain